MDPHTDAWLGKCILRWKAMISNDIFFFNQITLQCRNVMPCAAHFWSYLRYKTWQDNAGPFWTSYCLHSSNQPHKQNWLFSWFFCLILSFTKTAIATTFEFPILSPTAKESTLVENKLLVYQLREAMGSPEKAGQCCHFQSDWHWAVSLHSTGRDSALVANTGSSVTAAVQSKIVWKHEWMVDLVHKKCDAKSEWCLPVHI